MINKKKSYPISVYIRAYSIRRDAARRKRIEKREKKEYQGTYYRYYGTCIREEGIGYDGVPRTLIIFPSDKGHAHSPRFCLEAFNSHVGISSLNIEEARQYYYEKNEFNRRNVLIFEIPRSQRRVIAELVEDMHRNHDCKKAIQFKAEKRLEAALLSGNIKTGEKELTLTERRAMRLHVELREKIIMYLQCLEIEKKEIISLETTPTKTVLRENRKQIERGIMFCNRIARINKYIQEENRINCEEYLNNFARFSSFFN